MINLYGLEITKLEQEMLSRNQKKFRATQLYSWIYGKNAQNFDDMSDISKSFIEELKRDFCLSIPKIYRKQESKDGTIKLLLELEDGNKIETALMPYNYGNAICVTSQVGCNMGCSFCASGLLKKKRNLEVHELVGQVLVMNNLLKEKNPYIYTPDNLDRDSVIKIIRKYGNLITNATKRELMARQEVIVENYYKSILIEAETMIDMLNHTILPGVFKYKSFLADEIVKMTNLSLNCELESEKLKRISNICKQVHLVLKRNKFQLKN